MPSICPKFHDPGVSANEDRSVQYGYVRESYYVRVRRILIENVSERVRRFCRTGQRNGKTDGSTTNLKSVEGIGKDIK